MLQLEELHLTQGSFHLSANWSLPQGHKVAVIGPSGAGKSTLLMALAGFLMPKRGRILWQRQDLTRTAPGKRPVSMLFQDANLFPHLSIADNVGLGIRPDLRLNQRQRADIESALARVGLSGMQTRKPAELSGGQQSRAALARVLVQRKPLILLDEPFAALGPALRREMLALVAELADENNATLIMVSHAPEDARQIADLTVLVADQNANAPVETGALFENPPDALRAYLG